MATVMEVKPMCLVEEFRQETMENKFNKQNQKSRAVKLEGASVTYL